MELTDPPVALALKPETKLIAVWLPFSTLRPLNDAPLTASVSCEPSDASAVLTFEMTAPGFCASVNWVAMAFSVVMTESIADVAVDRTDWPSESALCEAVTMPLSEPSCWAIDQ